MLHYARETMRLDGQVTGLNMNRNPPGKLDNAGNRDWA